MVISRRGDAASRMDHVAIGRGLRLHLQALRFAVSGMRGPRARTPCRWPEMS
jgi:hypothetical protein